MDGFLIVVCKTKQNAETVLTALNSLAAVWWQSQGYTVINDQLIGKNAATGKDEPDSARTITWDTVKESPDKTFYFTSTSNSPQFKDALSMLPAEVQALYTEIEMPAEWMPKDA